MEQRWAGLDEPIADPTDDDLGRAPFAKLIAARILSAPVQASFRIGVYGEWGEGKTSVLGMAAGEIKAKGDVAVWLRPWAYTTTDDLNAALMTAIADEVGVDKSSFKRARQGDNLLAVAERGNVDLGWKLNLAKQVLAGSLKRVASRWKKGAGNELLAAIYQKLQKPQARDLRR